MIARSATALAVQTNSQSGNWRGRIVTSFREEPVPECRDDICHQTNMWFAAESAADLGPGETGPQEYHSPNQWVAYPRQYTVEVEWGLAAGRA